MRVSGKTAEDIAGDETKQEREGARQYITLEELANLTNAQIDTYIDNNVTSLASARAVLKKLVKWNRALTKAIL